MLMLIKKYQSSKNLILLIIEIEGKSWCMLLRAAP